MKMGRVGLRCANPTCRVGVDLLVVENLVQRVGFQYPVGPDVYLLGGGLFQALMHVLRQRAEATRKQMPWMRRKDVRNGSDHKEVGFMACNMYRYRSQLAVIFHWKAGIASGVYLDAHVYR